MTDFSQRILSGGTAASGETAWSFARFGRRPSTPANSDSNLALSSITLLLDRLAFTAPEGGAGDAPLRRAFVSGAAEDLSHAVAALSEADRRRLRDRIPEAALQELLSIAREGDASLFAESLLGWAQRQENEDRLDAALLAYQLLSSRSAGDASSAGIPEALRRRAELRLDAVLGRGAFGARAEFLARRFAREASNPVTIAGMAAGSLMFSTARTALLSRLLAAPGRSVLGARALASTGAFLLEVPTFWATTKGLNEALAPGSQRWDLATNARELAGLGLTLGALKLTGALAGGLSQRLASSPHPAQWGGLERFGHGLLQQGGMLGGIMIGHRLEEAVGLRPHLDGATTLIDSLSLLLQFHVGGRLSQQALGPRFQAYSQSLEARSRFLEAEAAREWRTGWDDFLGGSWGGRGSRLVPAAAVPGRGRAEARELIPSITQMSGDPNLPEVVGPGILAMTGGEGGETRPVLPPRERGIRSDIAPDLPLRTGKSPDDLFSPPMPPAEILSALRGRPVYHEISSLFEARTGDWEEMRDSDLGAAVGEALNLRLHQIARHPAYEGLRALARENLLSLDYSRVPRYETLPPELRQALDSAAELMQVTQYAIRSNQVELLNAARAQLRPEHQAVYQELLSLIRVLKGPRLVMPSGSIARGAEVLGPEQAILSHGAGAMSSWLRVISRRVVPGGLPWYTRFFATEANYQAVRGLRQSGKNPFMSPAMSHNFEGDPPIEAVYFRTGDTANSEAVASVLFRTVRVQMLNVPAMALPGILNEAYIRQLPERAILVSAIGGVVESRDAAPQYPNEFVRSRLDRYGRSDVEVVSLSGYVPADKLWMGERVAINLSTREDPEQRGQPRSAAFEIARLLAGESRENDFVEASVSHWERSANVGKVAKNVFTLMAGLRAGRIARRVADDQVGLGERDPRLLELRNGGLGEYNQALSEIKEMMKSVLVQNEGIRFAKANYNNEVWVDFSECATVYFDNLVELFRRARQFNAREATVAEARDFLRQHVFEAPRDRRVATTRNPRYGVARAVHELWVDMGLPFRDYGEIGPNVTVEGLNSLDPIINLYRARQDIEQRRLPDAVYELHRTLFGRRIEIPPAIPRYLRMAIARNPEGPEASQLQTWLREVGLSATRIRSVSEGSDERTLTFLARELRRFMALYQMAQRSRVRGNGVAAAREARLLSQVEFLRQLKEAASRGDIVGALRMPEPIGPYENAFVIDRQDAKGGRMTHQVFIRLNLEAATLRLTQLGMLLRHFPPGDSLEVEIRIPEESCTPANLTILHEVESTLREITHAFQAQRPGEIRLSFDRRRLEREGEIRRESPSDDFYQSLEPMARWVLGREPGAPVEADEVRRLFRRPRHEANGVLDHLIRDGNGWVMLLTPAEGPVQSAIRAMLTRPEKGTLMGVYSGGQLVDTFGVYRFNGREARVLSHHLLSDLRRRFPDNPRYQNADSVDYFQGFPIEEFLRDYPAYAERRGMRDYSVHPIVFRSTPIEEALVGRNPALNPALLKLFLFQPSEEAASLLRAAEPLYEQPPEAAREAFTALAQPYLQTYREQLGNNLEQNPLFRLYERFGFLPRPQEAGEGAPEE
ncbi:MAG: hypothetical protein U1F66_01625 [bacterium]